MTYYQVSIHAQYAYQVIELNERQEAQETAARLDQFFKRQGIDLEVNLFMIEEFFDDNGNTTQKLEWKISY